MIARQGLNEYAARTKEQYRGWVLNRIVERLNVPVQDATMAYLCGPEDRDRKKAVWKGFRTENLIAVDKDIRCVNAIRKGGGLAFHGDMLDLITHGNISLDVIHADFCCGLTGSALDLLYPLFSSKNVQWGSVVVVNMQRGRENLKDWTPKAYKEVDLGGIELERMGNHAIKCMAKVPMPDGSVCGKHRGRMWMIQYIYLMMSYWYKSGCITAEEIAECSEVAWKAANPSFYSYVSNKVQMDSVVISIRSPHGVKVKYRETVRIKRVKKKATATKAIRTMYKNRKAGKNCIASVH